tara:strand:+ start:15384 stop:15524 length:141 start_codon:yes stop_codon:yes gene_type:complete
MILTGLFQGIVTLMLIAGTITSVESTTSLDITGLKAKKEAIFQTKD